MRTYSLERSKNICLLHCHIYDNPFSLPIIFLYGLRQQCICHNFSARCLKENVRRTHDFKEYCILYHAEALQMFEGKLFPEVYSRWERVNLIVSVCFVMCTYLFCRTKYSIAVTRYTLVKK